ncbi:MAG: hypothetical protein Q7R70_00080 [Candidatus Diapherotrites archaeon]|nr:hypothetical protein [Candidatus Diapherotrites archaeon]
MLEKTETLQEPFVEEKPMDLVELIYAPDWKTILLDLVQSERMDAWDIDLTALAEKYYVRIQSLTETNLRIPANAMLCSAILLRFKSKKLRISSIEDAEELAIQEQALELKNTKLFADYDPFLKNPRMNREGTITLNDLVSAIEEMMEKSRQKSLKKRLDMPEFKLPFSGINIEERIAKTLEDVNSKADSQGLCLFSQLTEGKNPIETIDVFLPVLFLCTRDKINAWQEEWFGEIFISIISS